MEIKNKQNVLISSNNKTIHERYLLNNTLVFLLKYFRNVQKRKRTYKRARRLIKLDTYSCQNRKFDHFLLQDTFPGRNKSNVKILPTFELKRRRYTIYKTFSALKLQVTPDIFFRISAEW